MESLSIVSLKEISVDYAGRTILDNINFSIHKGKHVGLVGRNGAGKTTLLNIIAGADKGDSGEVAYQNGLRVSYMAQRETIEKDQTVEKYLFSGAQEIIDILNEYEETADSALENILRNLGAWSLEGNIDKFAKALGCVEGSRYLKDLSGGEFRRVDLCRNIIANPDLLILDEPTNHLDPQAIEWLENYLRNFKGTFILVTHDRYFLDQVCDSIVEVDNGSIYRYSGGYTDFLEGRAERISNENLEERRRQSFLRKEVEWVRRSPKARTTKNKGRVQRFEEQKNVEKPTRLGGVELLLPPPPQLGNRVIELKDVSICLGGKTLLEDFSLEIEAGQCIGIVGGNGVGKTTLLKIILSQLTPDQGIVQIGQRCQFNYIDQNLTGLDPEKTVFEQVGEGNDFVTLGDRKISLWSYLKRFLFSDQQIKTKIHRLSGGEKRRVSLAIQFKRGGNCLLLDEPTNDLDIETMTALEEAIIDFPGCVLAVSHDRFFLDRVCHSIIAFEKPGKVVQQVGGYSYYEEKKKQTLKDEISSSNSKPIAKPKETSVKRKRLSYKEKIELENMEDNILEKEARIEEIQKLFAQPDFYENYADDLQALQEEVRKLEEEVQQGYKRWEELEELNKV